MVFLNGQKMLYSSVIINNTNKAVVYSDYESMVEDLNTLADTAYVIGQNFFIVTLNVPDLWVSGVKTESVPYTYVDDDTLVAEIKTNGSVQIGCYVISALETQKVDLTEYVKFTDYAGNVIAGEKAGVIGLNYAASCGLHFGYSGKNKFLQIATPDTIALKRRNGRYGLVVGELDSYIKTGITGLKQKQVDGAWVDSYGNQIALTDEEKASALSWLGALKETEAVYTCNKYKHQALIEGYISDQYGFASSEILTEDELSKCEIDVKLYDGYEYLPIGTISMEGARVITLEGGYAFSVDVSSIRYGCPDARVIVVTDTEAFNRTCSCDLESTGIYLSYSQVDNDAMQTSYTTRVMALRTTALKVSNEHLYLEGHPYIKALITRIEALENK